MKIKGLLLGMFACAALVACTNDDIVENTPDINDNKSEKAEAYLTFAIASATNSSRANTGDAHGDEDDSEHSNVGTEAENKVNKIMIVFYNTAGGDADGVARVYDLSTSNSGLTKNGDDTYAPTEPYQLSSTGTYNTLVIINPCSAVEELAGPSGITSGATSVKTIYDTILSGNYTGNVSGIIGSSSDNFMMANQKAVTITVTANNNTPALAATPENDDPISVERVASKITFRPSTLASAPSAFTNKTNLYNIKVDHTSYTAKTVDGWVSHSDGTYTYYEKFNVAKDKNGRDIYVLVVTKDGTTTTTYYVSNGSVHTGSIGGTTGDTEAIIMNETTIEGRPIYVQDTPGATSQEDYYVRLERYALVNLSQSVFYVRHTADVPTVTGTPWGTVSSSKYLSDPYTPAKSGVTFTDGGMSATAANLATWFGTTDWTSISTAIANAPNSTSLTMFSNLLGSVPEDEYETGKDGVTGNTPESSTVGTKLAYCMENVVSAANQKLSLTTGIIFEGQIYAKDGSIVSRMYELNGQYYLTLRALNAATGDAYPYLKYSDENPDDDAIIAAGINIYKEGKCYYFSSQIKHFDYGTSGSGVMEYAIMRNNIYSLAVSNLNGFGFDSTSISEVPVDGGVGDQSVYLTLTAKILPWVVRFNNIEF